MKTLEDKLLNVDGNGNESPPDVEKSIVRYILPVRERRTDKRKLKRKTAAFFLYRVA